MAFVSYAQNFEDVLLHRVFGGQETGFYIDVGAYHPVDGSTTKAFYDRGWSGINIEPGSVFTELAAARPRDVNLQMAVMDRGGEIAFIEDTADRGMSHIVEDEADGNGARRMVPCDTLEAIVRAHSRGRPVDFIKVDAEGAEVAIVRSTDWRALRPRVLLLEATLPWSSVLANQEWEPTLLEHGYIRTYFDGINCFYIPEEEAPALSRHFRVPVNALDQVLHHSCFALSTALDSQRQETARLAAERDAIRSALTDQQQETARIAAQADAIRAAMENQQQEAATLAAELDAVRAAMGNQQQEAARLAAERDAIRAEAERSGQAAQELAVRLASPPPPVAGGGVRRRAVLAAYKLVRPVVRPLAWRFRSFLMAGLSEQLQNLNQRIVVQPGSPLPIQVSDGSPAGEMRRLAAEMERALLTLAMERTPDIHPDFASTQPPDEPESSRVRLLLPHGHSVEVACAPGDLSITASLVASGGDWEPHVRRYLETVVQPDWVCLDIGANMGAHTLSLAVLAHTGRVVAFEADAANFALLSRNADALADRRAKIDPVHVALWDSRGTLACGGANELAGCSFVADDTSNHAAFEQRLRTVVDSDAINGTTLHMRMNEVPALPLDAWVEGNPLPRLNLIKLDVEGAEVRVLRGADATLRRHRPILVVEYNPACAGAYFGQSPDALFHELETRFAAINVLEPDGSLTPVPDWPGLQTRLAGGKGWEDLVCLPEAPPRLH